MSLSERNFCRTSAKSWLCHAKHVEFTQKSAFMRNNSNLFHYAGNNPVKYTDPDGKYDVDFDTMTIDVNLDSQADIKKAENFYKYNQNFQLTALNKNGDYISFSNFKTYKNFCKTINGKNNKIEDIISMLGGMSFGISEIGKSVEEYAQAVKALSTISNVVSGISLTIDMIQMAEDSNFSNAIDLLSDVVGFIPSYGPLISVEIQLYKSTSIALGDVIEFGNKYVEYKMNQSLFDYYGF